MSIPSWRMLLAASALFALTACGGGSSASSGDVQITLQAQFQKQLLTPSGFSGTSILPARYCYAEVVDAGSGSVLASGYLGSSGTGTVNLPQGSQIYVQVYAEYQVPSADPANPFMQGRVLNAPMFTTSTISSQAFQAYPTWSVRSDTLVADQDGTLTITAQTGNRIAGAFNIADQAVTFASTVRDLDGTGTLRLPDLDTFWTTSTRAADQTRTYPAVTLASSTTLLQSAQGRAIFTHQVEGLASGAPNTETDEWDDGVLQETFAHLLFADDTYKPDGSSALSLLRRDNDNVYVSRYRPSESTVAFVDGFCDFLAGAALRQSPLLDSYVDASGVQQVDDFDLASHAMVPAAAKGEFTRGSIAVSLWGIWQNALGGSFSGLQTLWSAVRSGVALPDGTGEYEGATLGCYPSYLLGVQSRAGSAWPAVLNELSLESIPAPTPAYFSSNALWLTVGVPFSGTGALQTYDASQARYYDQNQSQAYRFTQLASGTRTLTLTPGLGGQDFYVELLGPGGWIAGNTTSTLTGQVRTLTVPNLPPGVYAVRVRAGVTSATGTYSYTLSLN
ncbi:MAG TPA: hypothetical protein VF768_01265 [Holophagaceae bacterium]